MPAPSALVYSLVNACRQVLRADGYPVNRNPVHPATRQHCFKSEFSSDTYSRLSRLFTLALDYSPFSFRHGAVFSPGSTAWLDVAITACGQTAGLAARAVCGRDTFLFGELPEDSDSYP